MARTQRSRSGAAPRARRQGGVLPDYLIDSNVLIGTLRGQGVARELLTAVAERRCAVSVLTRAELLLGVRGRLAAETLLLLRQYRALDVDADIADLAARFGRQYRSTHSGKLPDLLIAATAVVHRLQLVTLNRRDFPMPEVSLYPVPS